MPHPTADISAFLMKDGYDRASEVEYDGIYHFRKLRTYKISAVSDQLPLHPNLLGDKDFFVEDQEEYPAGGGKYRKLRAIKLGNLYIELQRGGKESFEVSIYYINSSRRDGLELLVTIDNSRYGPIKIKEVLPLDFDEDAATTIGFSLIEFGRDNYSDFASRFRELLTKLIKKELTPDELMGFLDAFAAKVAITPISSTPKRSLNLLLDRLKGESYIEDMDEDQSAEVDVGIEDVDPTPQQKYAEYVESHKDILTPATILWHYALQRLGSEAPTNWISSDNFFKFLNELVFFPMEARLKDEGGFNSDRVITIDNLFQAFAINRHTSITFEHFQRMINTFAPEKDHFRFDGAVFAAFKAANYPIAGGLDKLPVAKVKHVCCSLLPLASEILAKAVNNAIYGFIPGAWVGFLPREKVDELLLNEGKGLKGTYVVRLSQSRPGEIAISYLSSTPGTGGAAAGASSDAKSELKVIHEILQPSMGQKSFVFRGVEYPTIAEVISHHKKFLKIPCLRARLMEITGSSIATPHSEKADFKLLKALRNCLDGDKNPINPQFYDIISQSIAYILKGDPFARRPDIFVPKASGYSRYLFDAFHGCIIFDQTLSRLHGKKPGTYLLRLSQDQRGALVLAFVDATGTVQQSRIKPHLAGSEGKVECSGNVFPSLRSCILAYSTALSEEKKALLQYPLEPGPLEGVAARSKISMPAQASLRDVDLPIELCIGWKTFIESREKPISVETEAVKDLRLAKAIVDDAEVAFTDAEAAVARAVSEAHKARARLEEARIAFVKAQAAGGSGSELTSAYSLFKPSTQGSADPMINSVGNSTSKLLKK